MVIYSTYLYNCEFEVEPLNISLAVIVWRSLMIRGVEKIV